jgi:hypothetical protein
MDASYAYYLLGGADPRLRSSGLEAAVLGGDQACLGKEPQM